MSKNPEKADPGKPVAITLSGGNVTAGFRSAVFDAANRHGMSVNEFVLEAAGSWLTAAGYDFPDVFPVDPNKLAIKQPPEHRYFRDERGRLLGDERGAVLAERIGA